MIVAVAVAIWATMVLKLTDLKKGPGYLHLKVKRISHQPNVTRDSEATRDPHRRGEALEKPRLVMEAWAKFRAQPAPAGNDVIAAAWVSAMKARRAAKASALRIVRLLTEFAYQCDLRASWNEAARYSDVPKLPPYVDDIAWEALSRRIAVRVLRLPTEISNAEIAILSARRASPEKADIIATESVIYLGYTAIEIAHSLRRRYRLGRHTGVGAYDFASDLRRKYRRLHQSRINRAWASARSGLYRMRRRLRRSWLAKLP
jgi:hypothetical protein